MNPRIIDWERIEREYRAGQLSVAEIGRQCDISHQAINKRAKREGWTRNLAGKVRAEVAARLVAGTVATCNTREAIDNAAARGVELVRQHQHTIGRGRAITLRLLDELEASTCHVGELEEMIEAETLEDRDPRRRNAMLKAVSLPGRSGVVKDLSLAARNWIGLERQAFNLDEPASLELTGKGGGPIKVAKAADLDDDVLAAIAAGVKGEVS